MNSLIQILNDYLDYLKQIEIDRKLALQIAGTGVAGLGAVYIV